MSRRAPVLHRILESFCRHFLVFLALVFVVTAFTIWIVQSRTQTYQAVALTQVVKEDVNDVLGPSGGNDWTTPAQENVNHFNDLINDDLPGGFLDQALKSANLANPINVDPRAGDPRYAELRKRLTAVPQSDTLFAINLTWDSKDDCEAIVSALQKQYIEEVGLDKSADATATGHFLDSQITDYADRLQKSEQALILYKSQNQGQDPDQQSAAIGQLTTLQAQLDEAQITARDSDLKIGALQDELKSVSPMSVLSRTEETSPLAQQLMDLKVQLDELKAKYTPNHPEVISKQQEVDSLQQELNQKQKSNSSEAVGPQKTEMADNPQYADLKMQITEAKIGASTQQAEIQNLQARIAQYQTEISKIPEAEKELTEKTRSYDILKDMYNTLLTKREDVRLKSNLDRVSATSTLSPIGLVFAEPTLTRTKKMLLVAGSVVLGIVIGLLYLVLTEWTDNTLRYEGDSEHLLGVPVLALLPDAPDLRFLPGGGPERGQRLLTAGAAAPGGALPGAGSQGSAPTQGTD